MDYQGFKIYDKEAENLIKGLRVAECMNLQEFQLKGNNFDETTVPYNLKELAVSDVLMCSYCNVTFPDATNQRSHYKLDWHRYNLKRALSGNKSVTEEIFNTLADDVSSISGSDSEGSEDTDTEAIESVKNVNPESFKGEHKSFRHAKLFLENGENKILSVYKCLLHSKKEHPVKDELIKRVNDLLVKPKKWMIVLLGGGHFASAIVSDGEILNHKTFHCYTVRAKQGGSQSSRDNKGGSHPKSAGASLRRYNEQALVQHVQEVMTSWSEAIRQCSLILYRATGPYNRGVLFGGKNPPLSKTDLRLRNIPFPTRRATFKEVKRVYDMLSSIEIYGIADNFKDKYPPNPDKRSLKYKTELINISDQEQTEDKLCETKEKSPKRKSLERCCHSPQRYISEENVQSLSESEDENENDFEMISRELTVSFQDLQEYEDTVPQFIKNLKNNYKQKKKRKKSRSKQGAKLERKKFSDEFEQIQQNLIKSCENEDKELLKENLNIYFGLPKRKSEPNDCSKTEKASATFSKEDFIDCLNAPINEENKNTLLHLAAIKGLSEFVALLMTSGADPTIKNKNKLTPYVMADKETRNAFRSFASSFPNKYDFKKANIPEPLNEEQAKELEKKKKERKKLKRDKEKIKRQEEKEKRNEEEERKKFLALSDREKCALAAERRILASSSLNLKSAKHPVLSRCFQCGIDISGIVAFEYGTNRFCSMPCLKAHRLKTNNYGKEI